MHPVLRKATPGEEFTLEAIELDCFARPHWTAAEFVKYQTTVAELDGKVVAFAVSYQVYDHPRESEFEILNIAVLPAYRRMGIARALLGNVLQHPGTYFLEVRESNAAARALYASLSFEEVGRRPSYYENPDETAIVMRVKRC